MKRIISIILILVIALYVLPLSEGFIADTETASQYVDKNIEDGKDTKKDNGKEFIAAAIIPDLSKNCTAAKALLPFLYALPVHFTIETPPPDAA